jgi:hypothetical protein
MGNIAIGGDEEKSLVKIGNLHKKGYFWISLA